MSELSSISAFGGTDAHSTAILRLVQDVVENEMGQVRAQMTDSSLRRRAHMKELVNEQIRMVAFMADSTIASAQSKRLLTKLTDKFKLIDSFQRSLG
ncbi:hypothetical protein [Chelativorans sp. Marseille-P2723]|uniref:hypothetical protein n=1 Tax=Chelativorans sp. Marseille-P2723 TaxID=2709133 RepID=UPI00156F4002|nr:hypothetical protein [Chelativorans sp. Marseille-P2723]